MWIKEYEFREQPEIHYKHSLLMQLRGVSGADIVWSTFPYFNFLMQNNLRVPSITV